jgi:S1-C subfamily serine protease
LVLMLTLAACTRTEGPPSTAGETTGTAEATAIINAETGASNSNGAVAVNLVSTPAPAAAVFSQPPQPSAPVATSDLMLQLPSIADTVERVRPAVVSILAQVVTLGRFGPQGGSSSGTGVIITADGLVLTNNHVVEGAETLTVTLDDGKQLKADIVGVDRLADLAVLRLPQGEYPFLPVSGDIQLRPGEWVIAIGNALALPGGPTVTVGVVSALGRSRDAIGGTTLNDLVQTDTVINPGNSGGPLLNTRGELVGINTAVLRGGSRGSTPIEGISFAINMATVSQVSAQLIEIGHVRWAYMGLNLDDLTPEIAARASLPIREGVVVLGVGPGGPSERAGLLRGDIILSMDGQKVGTVIDLLRLLRKEFQSGQEIEIEIFRNGSSLRLPLVLGERPPV